ncbi:MAG: PcfJ domain-containing protein, partial [Clostridia bacterium]|nr:PcfJ domain-containing protein [Clostridia bacterium]
DGWSVLRMIKREYNTNNLIERERMYLHDDGKNRIVTKERDNWVPSKQFNPWGSKYKFINRDEAMEKCNRLKYLLPLFDANEEKIRQYIMTALRFPEVEQLMKLGYTEEAKIIANSTTPRADLKDLFGGHYNEKEKSLLKKAGMTKHQFDKVLGNGQRWNNSRALEQVRKITGDDFIHLDNETFDGYFEVFKRIGSSLYSGYYNYAERLNLDLKKLVKNIARLAKRNQQAYQLYHDTMSTYLRLEAGTEPAVDWYFDDFSDLRRMHDAVVALANQQYATRNARWSVAEAERMKKDEEKRKKLDEKRKEWEYEDDEFVVRLPKDGAEIIAEGSKQRICIGGYVSSHSTGACTLFFVRKKSEPDTPFYAIEIRNGVVIQIHGAYNCWLGNNPEAIPTVIRWLRKNNFKCDPKILTCTATGYGQTANYIQLPVVVD